ncbi:MAG TPA: hypothetical protein VKF35_19850 [Hyphomicrobiaceae bacterium]|nr:hypothetical protein [Hyphomicrobiaceae bacterium]
MGCKEPRFQENATMAKGLLLAAFDFSGAHADEFHDWYDLEHIPERRAVAGFGACERWIGTEQPAIAVATYDLESIDVLRSEAYKAIAYGNLSVWSKRVTAMCQRLLRFEGTQLTPGAAAAPDDGGGLLLNAMNVAPEAEADFNAWYDEEHLPALARVPGTLAARRYRSAEAESGSHRYVALYHLESPTVTQSAAWKAAVDTSWSAKVRPHFRNRIRILARRYVRGG